ncbi:MAG: CgeB family protein [Desulfovibrionaceae bacterium]
MGEEDKYIIERSILDGGEEEIAITHLGERTLLSSCGGKEREKRLIQAVHETMPEERESAILLLGVGSGYSIEYCIKHGIKCVVVDREGLAEYLEFSKGYPEITVYREIDFTKLYEKILSWQVSHKGVGLIPFIPPLHKKNNKEYYQKIFTDFQKNIFNNVWKQIQDSPRFIKNRPCRILFIPEYYCLRAHIENACKRIGVECISLHMISGISLEEQASRIIQYCIKCKPDYILTINHWGFENNVLAQEVIEATHIPVASWFVDSPDIILGYEEIKGMEYFHIFTWEKSTIERIRSKGYTHVEYLPLATDPTIFSPKKKALGKHLQQYKSDFLFVGATGVTQFEHLLARTLLPYRLYTYLEELAQSIFIKVPNNIKDFLEEKNIPEYRNLSLKQKKEYALLVFFYANTYKRTHYMKALSEYKVTIAGDVYWKDLLGKSLNTVLPPVVYMSELPLLYPHIAVNLNITSVQMKESVNQRVFDIPACGSFVLTDDQKELYDLFEVGKEIIAYSCIEEMKELMGYYLAHPRERNIISMAGRKRVLEEHTFEKRMQNITNSMQKYFG